MSVTGLTGVFGFHRQAGPGQTAKGPYNAGVGSASVPSTVQKITISAGATGTFRLGFRGFISSPINVTGDAAALETAIGVMQGFGPSGYDVLKPEDINTTKDSDGFTISFNANYPYEGQPVGFYIYDSSLSVGATISISATTTGGRWYWLPATSVNFQPNQIVQSIPMEVGGDLWARGSYKGGVSGQGQVMFVPRGGLGLAELFYAFTGANLVPTNSDADFATAKTANKLIGTVSNSLGNTKLRKYRFIPQSGTQAELPWYTIIRNVGGKFVEEYGDARLGNFAFDMAASNILNIDASFVSRSCGTVAYGSGGSSAGEQVGNQTAGNGIPFQSVDAVVKLDTRKTDGEPGPVAQRESLNPTRLNIAFANQLSQNEFVVGSYYLQDITNQSRTANVTYSVYLKDPDLYARTYAYGKDIVTQSQAWSSKIWKGALELSLTGGDIAGTTSKYAIKITIPEMDYMATPISLAGNNLVEYQLTTNVVLSQKAGETDPAARVYPFEIEYVTDEDIV
jgi:hypothetical protein